ncbi:SpoIIE family protein phosphatase [Streptomyces cocklensis]|uniref:protein-serine/threonine phosphatase n=1 Tax=Actinacidiphila cocklensis TaxID=887465 RepID=A0A9W4DWX5_9ACTN|nr:SpoIIE family protein phosphatase [Actinacidiphila cocklensis]MDD1062195.1 SpoIIE family protein phosphatase [Actinacidiphila cocklensis]CAG6397655.1 GAF domain-containing protein [Actinacidiphila cocklensis]
MGKGAEGPAEHGRSPAGSPNEPVAAEAEPGTPGAEPGKDSAELRQIDTMNRFRPDPAGHPAAADSATGADAGRVPPRRRDALLLETGHDLAEAESLSAALRTVTGLFDPDFSIDGLVVFGVTDKFLNVIGQYGFRTRDSLGVFRMPVTSAFPANEVVRSGRPVYLSSPREYRERFAGTWPLAARFGRKSWAFLPLVASGRISAVCLIAFRRPMEFTADERALLVLTARLVAQALERTRTSSAELALSRGLRRSMGAAAPAVPGLSVATRYVPTGGGLVVGGDWYDVINLPGGRLAVVIGDVQGHDVHAAGLMAQLRTAVYAYAAEGHGPDAVLSRASRFLAALDEDRFATCLYIEAEPSTGMLHIARAGHPHPVLRLPDGTCMLKHVGGGLPLGLMPGTEDYPVTDLELHPDEILMLCTDGLIETGGHDMYSGWIRVRDAMSPGSASDLEGIAERLIRAVHDPLQQPARQASGEGHEREPDAAGVRADLAPRNEDDIALLLLRRDAGVQQRVVPERKLVLTIEQDQAEGLSEARAELQALLHDWAQPDQVDTAVLLTSELVGNVLMHTDQSAALNASMTGEPGRRVLRVEVSDNGDELPHQRTPGEMASSGRGLMLLDILSGQWSVRPESEGKTVWFSLWEDEESTEEDPAGSRTPAQPPADLHD